MRIEMKTILFWEIRQVIDAHLASNRNTGLQTFLQEFLRLCPGTEFFSVDGNAQRVTGSLENKTWHGAKSKGRSVIHLQQGNIDKEQPRTDPECQRLCYLVYTDIPQQARRHAILAMRCLYVCKIKLHVRSGD